MHKVLERQIKKAFGGLAHLPEGLEAFLKMISDTYEHTDEDRALVERALEISSRELAEFNKKIVEESEKIKLSNSELERMNRLMVDRELKMIELKKEIAHLRSKHNDTTTQ
jgi:hypothetical protein